MCHTIYVFIASQEGERSNSISVFLSTSTRYDADISVYIALCNSHPSRAFEGRRCGASASTAWISGAHGDLYDTDTVFTRFELHPRRVFGIGAGKR